MKKKQWKKSHLLINHQIVVEDIFRLFSPEKEVVEHVVAEILRLIVKPVESSIDIQQ